MLERTAVGIETCTCSLQKALPTAASAAASAITTRRRLHTSFWSHGASSIELLDACSALMSLPSADRDVPPAAPALPKSARRPDTMTASAFLLDFLYPGGAAALLQRLRPTVLQRSESSQPVPSRVSARAFTSSAPGPDDAGSRPGNARGALSLQDILLRGRHTDEGGPQIQVEGEALAAPVFLTAQRPPEQVVSSGRSDPQVLRDLLNSSGESYELIWQEYMSLKPVERLEFRTALLVHLAKSNRVVDSERVSRLFSNLTPEEWAPETVNAAIKASLVVGDKESALQTYQKAVSERNIGRGYDLLFSYGVKEEDWGFLTRLLPLHETATGADGETEYRALSSLSKFRTRMRHFHALLARLEPEETARKLTEQLNDFFGCIARTNLTIFHPGDATYILQHSKVPSAYHKYITLCIQEKRFEQAGKLYRRFRMIKDVFVPRDILRLMLDVYKNDLRGVELVMEDYYRFHKHLELNAIKKILPMYARRGHTESVAHLVREWAEFFPWSLQTDYVLSYANQMHAHAVRGEPDQARLLLDEAAKKLGKPPGPILWNILLNSYTKSNDYEGALRTLKELCDVGEPDSVSFGTVMNFASFRGDLDSTVDLFTLATDKGIEPDISMIDAVLESYCQNDRLNEAEGFCHKMTRTRPVEGDYVVLWNTLLRHLAVRRDLKGVNQALKTMKDYGVRYDNDTYSHLLTGLVNCRQSHHALEFLRTSVEHNIFRPTYDHYMLLMAAFVHSREPQIVLAIDQKLKELGIQGSSRQAISVIKALECWSGMPERLRQGKPGREFIARALKEFYDTVETDSPATVKDFAATTGMYSRMMFVLTQLRDFATVQELVELYQQQFPDSTGPEKFPLLLLHNILRADLYDKKYDSVLSTWEILLDRTIREGQPPTPNPTTTTSTTNDVPRPVLPAYRFYLANPLQTMQELYLTKLDPDGLIALIARVRSAGFELDRKNWNYHIQALATLQRWREAFSAFEQNLMPHWTGWAIARAEDPTVSTELPLELRRIGSNPKKLRPMSHTIFLLAREYAEMEREALWSNEATRKLEVIRRECPSLVHAIKTMKRTGAPLEQEIFEGGAVDIGEGRKRKTVAGDYFERVIGERLGVGKEDGDEQVSEEGVMDGEGAEEVRLEEGNVGRPTEGGGEAQEDAGEWEDVPEGESKEGLSPEEDAFLVKSLKRRRKPMGLKWVAKVGA